MRLFFNEFNLLIYEEKGARDAPAPRPNKKLRLVQALGGDEQPTELATPKIADASTSGSKSKKDAQVEEFMHVMQPRTKKARTWANDDPALDASSGPVDATMKDADAELDTGNGDEDEGTVEEVDDLEWMKRRMQRGIKSVDEEEKVFSQNVDDDKLDNGSDSISKVCATIMAHAFF